jgi:hypothetical protein
MWWTVSRLIRSPACAAKASAILQTVYEIFPATGGWPFLSFVRWNGGQPLSMPSWKIMTE